MSQALLRIKELQAELAREKAAHEAVKVEGAKKDASTQELEAQLVLAKTAHQRLERQAGHLRGLLETKEHLIEAYSSLKEHDEEKIRTLNGLLEEANAKVAMLEREKRQNGARSLLPLTPPPSPAVVRTDESTTKRASTTSNDGTRMRRGSGVSGHKPQLGAGNQGQLKIYELRNRSNRRAMFRVSFDNGATTHEFHAKDLAEHHRDEVKRFLRSKLNYRNGRQIATIKDNGIECLIEIIRELEVEMGHE